MAVLLILVLAVPAFGGYTGDPLDSNDILVGYDSFSETGCADLIRFPNCVPCWNACMFAIMADAFFDGTIEWGW